MSKLSEGAKLKTDDERKAWFLSLSADEQAEVIAEMNIFLGEVREIFEPIAAAMVEWWKTAAPIFMKILESLPAESVPTPFAPDKSGVGSAAPAFTSPESTTAPEAEQ